MYSVIGEQPSFSGGYQFKPIWKFEVVVSEFKASGADGTVP